MERTAAIDPALESVTAAQAGKELGMSALTVRRLMEMGRLPIGYFKKEAGAKRGYCKIYRGLLDAEIERIRRGKDRW